MVVRQGHPGRIAGFARGATARHRARAVQSLALRRLAAAVEGVGRKSWGLKSETVELGPGIVAIALECASESWLTFPIECGTCVRRVSVADNSGFPSTPSPLLAAAVALSVALAPLAAPGAALAVDCLRDPAQRRRRPRVSCAAGVGTRAPSLVPVADSACRNFPQRQREAAPRVEAWHRLRIGARRRWISRPRPRGYAARARRRTRPAAKSAIRAAAGRRCCQCARLARRR